MPNLYAMCRHPATSTRPKFRDLVLALTGGEADVLSIPQEALDTHQFAGVLGSPLEAGINMYKDLQKKYIM